MLPVFLIGKQIYKVLKAGLEILVMRGFILVVNHTYTQQQQGATTLQIITTKLGSRMDSTFRVLTRSVRYCKSCLTVSEWIQTVTVISRAFDLLYDVKTTLFIFPSSLKKKKKWNIASLFHQKLFQLNTKDQVCTFLPLENKNETDPHCFTKNSFN